VTEINPKLLADLARLVGRYQPEDWVALSHLVADRDAQKRLADVLDVLAEASARNQPRRKSHEAAASTNLRARLTQMGEAEPGRAEVLTQLWTKLRARELLADMPSLRAFSQAVGMKALNSKRRDQAVSEIIEYLLIVPDESLEAALRHSTVNADRRLDDEYRKWVGLIVGRDRAQ